MKWRDWLVAVIGAWFIISPWAFGFSNYAGAVWTSVIAGALMLVASVWAGSREAESANWSNLLNWLSLIMGVWFVFQPWVMSISTFSGNAVMSVILGLVAIVLNAWTMSMQDPLSRIR
ncbi:SPW repeat protein [Alicyclobacillus mengziensis]|uniref:SPW repeat protein n=1 Tax=Alicyclobacillus mengziensis TaxID=2931921 RepID=A0A9X7VW05_9BACL|nr:SPW repeat protein [Alicyclobacillus mengziensis]QSO46076.1 SPW repeat protein [Alicyclobacillus mengziensis]